MPVRKRKPQYEPESSSESASESESNEEEFVPTKRKQPTKKTKKSKNEESDTDESESEPDLQEQEVVIDPAEIEERVRVLNKGKVKDGGLIIYWMSRDQRSQDNWALLYAQELARKHNANIAVVFTLAEKYQEANSRQFIFMLKGLQELESTLTQNYNIPFILLDEIDQLISFIDENNVKALICDFSPLKPSRSAKDQVIAKVRIPVYEVDTHNIIPVWVTSEKQEFAARTIRNKIHRQLPRFLTEFPNLEKQTKHTLLKNQIDWENVFATAAKKLGKVTEVSWITPGEKAARKFVSDFFDKKLKTYESKRNDPTEDGQSNISPYFHFGQISPQRVALDAGKYKKSKGYTSFIEEMVVRRELSDNFCFYNSNYDNINGFPDWAKTTLKEHAKDKREHLFSFEELEMGKTYDDLWNAAQHQLLYHGKLHGFMRMYWAKKILEWTKSPQEALSFAIQLNDKYEIDGNDPNGYVGCAWSVGGVHDRPWKERSVFGKIRYMNYAGCKRKFDVQTYVAKYLKKIR